MKVSELYTYAPKSKIKAGQANPNGKYQFYASSPDENRRCDDFLYDAPAIIMGTGGSATLHYYDGKFATSTDCLTLIPNEKVVPKYLYYFFLGNFGVLEAGFKGAGLKHTNKGYIDNIAIMELPSFGRQKEIVTLFDHLNLILTQKRKQIGELDNLIKARFAEMFGDRFINDRGWQTSKLGECVNFTNGKAHEQVINLDGQFVLITSKAIATDLKDVRRTNAMLSPLHTNNIVMVMSDVPNGRALAKCLLINEDNKYTLNQRICSFDEYDFNPIFLLYLLDRHPYFLSFNDGNGQTNLRKNNILDCDIISPPITLQNDFAFFVSQVDKSKLVAQKSLKQTQLLFDSLMDKYFG